MPPPFDDTDYTGLQQALLDARFSFPRRNMDIDLGDPPQIGVQDPTGSGGWGGIFAGGNPDDLPDWQPGWAYYNQLEDELYNEGFMPDLYKDPDLTNFIRFKSGIDNPGQKGPDGCTPEQRADLKQAAKNAQETIRKKIDDLKATLMPCNKDGSLNGLFQVLNDISDPGYLDELMSHMGCGKYGDLIGKTLLPPLDSNANHVRGTDYMGAGSNGIEINYDDIAQSIGDKVKGIKDRDTRVLTYDDLMGKSLTAVILHEMMHYCSGTYDVPCINELDAQILTNLLGDPVDPNGISNHEWSMIKNEQKDVNNPNPASGEKGSYFTWNPTTGEIQCNNGVTIPLVLHHHG